MIYVHEGEYCENVDVWKPVTLIGDGAEVVMVRAADAGDHVFNVTADWVNVSGFTVTAAGYPKAGINLSNGVDHCNISENNCSNNYYGICLSSSSDNTLTGNTISSNNRYGIYLSYSSGNTLANNTANRNKGGGIGIWSSSDNNTLANNDCLNNWCGISIYDSSANTLKSNTASSNRWRGIYLWHSSGNTLTGNTASSNNDAGIDLSYSSDNNTLANNTCANNDIGIELQYSSGNTLANNNLIDNIGYNTYDDGTNQWDSGSAGNYYSNHSGIDTNSDGIGDDPYPIPGGTSIDRFPLMHPCTCDTPLKGDLNGDNRITPADAAITLRIAASGAQNPAADVSGDDRVTSLDALMILQAAAG